MHLSHEDYERLRWLLAQVVAVLPDVTSGRILEMIHTAIDRAPDETGPLLSVGYNRWAEPAVSETRKTIKADAAETVFDVDCSDITWAVVDTGIDSRHPMFAATAPRDPHEGDPGSRVAEAYDIPAVPPSASMPASQPTPTGRSFARRRVSPTTSAAGTIGSLRWRTITALTSQASSQAARSAATSSVCRARGTSEATSRRSFEASAPL